MSSNIDIRAAYCGACVCSPAIQCVLPYNAGRRAPAPRSRVGQKLSNLTTSRVVVLVLSMLFILPAFNIGGGMYGTPPDLGIDGLKVRF